ncbi:hypothetical protein AB7813_14250 [Tardiphaga sp. 20_F10_N6_6]|jgi:hypothetical protein|uniref:hypothetical protein n=1 Tax=unclassified Tardiphaga TaxID=2631404 RepID=UPI001E3D35C5|nr:hypothetical protein [Tardiphaga sp. 37S4]UFS76337.1 hypothetical protein LPB73_02725 [Tardiphaga sp. 37S4]
MQDITIGFPTDIRHCSIAASCVSANAACDNTASAALMKSVADAHKATCQIINRLEMTACMITAPK